jgi:hypothetical protein
MGVQRHLGLDEPLAQRFWIDSKHLTTLDNGETGHEKDSFLEPGVTAN